MKHRIVLLSMLALGIVWILLLRVEAQSALAPADRESAWREDLDFFSREFPLRHKDFGALYPRAQWDAAIEALSRSIATTSDADIVLGLMRLVATAHVGHTYVRLPMTGPFAFHRLPIAVQWFADGLAITAATEPYRDALGLRITRIGKLAPELLQASVAPFIASEYDGWLRLQSQTFMVTEEVLGAVGQLDADGRVPVSVARVDGSIETLRLAPVPWAAAPFITVQAALNLPVGPASVEPNRAYRYELWPDKKTVYVRYNKCQDDPRQPFAAFVQELFGKVDAKPRSFDRAIIDLRANGGGNSEIIKPLLKELRARPALGGRGHLFALIGPGTFSSAVLAALDLRDMKAMLVGEAPGEQLRSYGEVRPLTLPRSGILVQYSTRYFKLGKAGPMNPNVRVAPTIADLIAGRDPVLERAIAR